MTDATDKLGVPYARHVKDAHGNLTLRKCPACGETFPETVNAAGEQVSGYARHYKAAHGKPTREATDA